MSQESTSIQKLDQLNDGEGSEPLVPAKVPEGLLEQMLEMGFPRNRAIRAIHFSNAEICDEALNWLVENDDAEDLDEPLFVKPKANLTPEEKKLQIENLRKVAKEKRDIAEKEAEIIRERERIRMGKELQEALRKEREQERQRVIEQRKREKEADRVAREKIRMKLDEDKKARRKKLGLPEGPTAQEKAKEEEKRQAKLREETERKKLQNFVKPVGVSEEFRKALVRMKKAGGEATFKQACPILAKLVGNVVRQPNEEKFRRIRLSNPTLQANIFSIDGGMEFLATCGFVPDSTEEFLVLEKDRVNMNALNQAGVVIESAITNPFFGSL